MTSTAAPAPLTPCVNICVVHPRHNLCLGCGRTPDEIGAWLSLSDANRRVIMASLKERLAALGRRPKRAAADRRS